MKLARDLSLALCREFVAAGAEVLLLACTELPVALANDLRDLPPHIDATVSLAQACVAKALLIIEQAAA
jgi:aspartate/glutamate racemase